MKNNFIKCIWTANGVVGQYSAYFINQLFPTYLLYVFCAFLNVVLIILDLYSDKRRDKRSSEEQREEEGKFGLLVQKAKLLENNSVGTYLLDQELGK